MNNNRPIGIFDSGVGGITVFKEIRKYLPYENLIYFGDTKHNPYGSKSKDTVTRLSTENVQFLLRKNVKYVVIACNTASALSLHLLRKFYTVPMIGVVDTGAKAAIETTKNGKIGVIGTRATIDSGAYLRALLKLDPKLKIKSLACPLFVPLVEEGWSNSKVAELTAFEYLKVFRKIKADTLVLGCTHYPFLKPVIVKILKNTRLIDSATETAKAVKKELEQKSLIREKKTRPTCTFYVTDAPERFKKIGSSFLGYDIGQVKLVEVE
ncbi:MAG: glutamate racemase [Candidatus Firestonebacteria bacterium RIFOXYA2_FULL_40_8]|nr:MAG: glutamate racemase [Candidatus Firestonebacteria bacterium RIFOXYA2_FULL_40_8]